jgi:aminoglycoside phosphotransferase (APT) family kinase protein
MQTAIADYLKSKLPGSPDVSVANLHRIPGGASRETWSVDAEWEEDGRSVSRGFIFRRDPDASVLVTERDIEFQVMSVARNHGVPVPQMYWLEQGGDWLERPFFVMERIDGCETSPTIVLMDPRFYPARERIGEQFVAVLERIHAIDANDPDLAFLGPVPTPESCAATEIDRWDEILARDALEPQPVLRGALSWLRRNLPPPAQRVVLVHADYRTGNYLCSPEGEITGMLDWEMAHLGDPMEDVGWACIRPWRWLGNEQVGGLMEREQFYRMYTEATGIDVNEEAVRFWEVLGNLKLAAIFVTGGRSFCDGRTHSPMMAFLSRNFTRLELEIMDLMEV